MQVNFLLPYYMSRRNKNALEERTEEGKGGEGRKEVREEGRNRGEIANSTDHERGSKGQPLREDQ